MNFRDVDINIVIKDNVKINGRAPEIIIKNKSFLSKLFKKIY